jgi:predicted nucleotidyltransferase
VRIFGSVARVAAGPDSDLDLLADVTSKTSPWLPASLIVDPEDLLDVTVDVTTSKSLHREIRDRLLAEARPL